MSTLLQESNINMYLFITRLRIKCVYTDLQIAHEAPPDKPIKYAADTILKVTK